MDKMTMRMDLVELYSLLGDNKGINFYYEELPGVVVSLGFTREEDIEDGLFGEGNDGEDDAEGNDGAGGSRGSSFH